VKPEVVGCDARARKTTKLHFSAMNKVDIPLIDVVLVGGGHSHVHVIKMFGMNPIPGVRVTLISKDIESPYSGMVPGYVAGYYTHDECHIDLGKLCSFAGVRLFHTEVIRVNTKSKRIFCADGRPAVAYDFLSINIGIVPRPLSTSSFFAGNASMQTSSSVSHGSPITAVKPIDKFATRWEIILARILKDTFTKTFTVAIVGGGAGGVELCFAVHHRLSTHLKERNISPEKVRVILINRAPTIMASHCRLVSAVQWLCIHVHVY
jgi:selenide, water dikinase